MNDETEIPWTKAQMFEAMQIGQNGFEQIGIIMDEIVKLRAKGKLSDEADAFILEALSVLQKTGGEIAGALKV